MFTFLFVFLLPCQGIETDNAAPADEAQFTVLPQLPVEMQPVRTGKQVDGLRMYVDK